MTGRTRIAIEPRGLSREEAAAYCGVTPRGLDNWVKLKIVPGPIAGTHRYDRKALDAALDRRSGLTVDEGRAEDAFEAWERSLEGHA